MADRYKGLPDKLRLEVLERDQYRCRWCGATNRGGDLHHIQYRRGSSYDRADNLITLCRAHHSFVHGTPNGAGQTIIKATAQQVLQLLVERPGTTGSSVWRSLKRQRTLAGCCEDHGVKKDACLECGTASYAACAECGNDDPAEGFRFCTDCLEALTTQEEAT